MAIQNLFFAIIEKMGQIQIVDSNDQFITCKTRDKVDFKKDIYRVSALWLTNSKGEILLARRKKTKDHDPGKWGPAVAGTVEEGETYKSNIYKEAEEELGLVDLKFSLGPKIRYYKFRNYFCQWFTLTLDRKIEEFTVCEEEVEGIAWVACDKLVEDIRKYPENYMSSMPKVIETFL